MPEVVFWHLLTSAFDSLMATEILPTFGCCHSRVVQLHSHVLTAIGLVSENNPILTHTDLISFIQLLESLS